MTVLLFGGDWMSLSVDKPAPVSVGREVWARLAWFVSMRWVAIALALLLLLTGWLALRPHFDPTVALVILGAVAFYNAVLTVLRRTIYDSPRRSRHLMEILANVQIALDLLALAALTHVTGGAGSIFLLFFIFPIIAAGEMLVRVQSFSQAAFAVLLVQAVCWLEFAFPGLRVHVLPPHWVQLMADGRLIGILSAAISFQIVVAVFLSSTLALRLRRRERQLEGVVHRLAEVDELKSFFLRKASHELRGPVGAVHSLLKLLIDGYSGPLTDKQQQLLDRADGRLGQMQHLVADLLKYSRLQGPPRREKLGPLRVDKRFAEAVELFAPRAQRKQVAVRCQLEPLTALADKEELGEIADNLISNAVKYTRAGGEVTVTCRVDGSIGIVTVRDTGIGMKPGDLNRIFTEFFRAANAKQETADGTGLGLSIVRRAVERYGGSVGVESTLDEGTTVTVRLPLAGKSNPPL